MKEQKGEYSIKQNGTSIRFGLKSTQIPGQILSLFEGEFQYLSIENMKERVETIIEMCRESGINCKRVFKALLAVFEKNNRQEIISTIYNTILASEGMGLLPGFGYAVAEKQVDAGMKIKRRFYENAEKVSILKVGN